MPMEDDLITGDKRAIHVPMEKLNRVREELPEAQELVSMFGTQDSDLFNLGPIIEAISQERKANKQVLIEVEGFEDVMATKSRSIRRRSSNDITEAEETSLEGSPKSP
ncbi:hypothetical protein TB1_035132 [Malus domestica]